jgi:hypothetical protein
MANLADTLVDLELVSARAVHADRVLAAQAAQLANTFRLADSADAELKRLKDLRAEHSARIARYRHARPSGR